MKELTSYTEIEEATKSHSSVIIDVWAEWCGPCRRFAPTFESVSKDFEDVLFVKVNLDQAEGIAGQLNVQSIPTIIFMKNGTEVHRQIGAPDEATFRTMIKEHLIEVVPGPTP